MSDYISREAALKAFQNNFYSTAMDIINRVPAADVAPVVRCKDCRYGKYAAWCNGYACCRTVGEYHRADFGCTAGERQTNGGAE